MRTRSELDAALAKAEADWRRANDDLTRSKAELIRANADWDRVVADRRKADGDRRKSGLVLDRFFPDRRKSDADRRNISAEIAALSRAVADRHEIYVERSRAEADWSTAELRLAAARTVRDKAFAALDAQDWAEEMQLLAPAS